MDKCLTQGWIGNVSRLTGLIGAARPESALTLLLESGETDVSVSVWDRSLMGGRSRRLGDSPSGN